MKIYFGLNVKHLRKTRNIEREELASRFDLHLSTISHWETGKHLPKVEDVVRLSEFFEVSIDDLLLKNLQEMSGMVQEKSEPYLSVSERNSHEIEALRRIVELLQRRVDMLEVKLKSE